MRYDFTDPLIRDLVDFNHIPTEGKWTLSGKPTTEVTCRKCGQSWPCEARQALRQHEEERS